MRFASWRDYYIFLKDYVNYSCLNCKHSGRLLDVNEEHSDTEYARHFCTFNIAIIDFRFQTLCAEWVDEDGHGLPSEDDGWNFKFSETLLDVFEEDENKKWTVREINEVVKDYESE